MVSSAVTILKGNYNLEEPLCWNNSQQADERLKVSGKQDEDTQNEEEWSEINKNTRKDDTPIDILYLQMRFTCR